MTLWRCLTLAGGLTGLARERIDRADDRRERIVRVDDSHERIVRADGRRERIDRADDRRLDGSHRRGGARVRRREARGR